MALALGTQLGPYRIIAAIGAGGMGEVYRALASLHHPHIASIFGLEETAGPASGSPLCPELEAASPLDRDERALP